MITHDDLYTFPFLSPFYHTGNLNALDNKALAEFRRSERWFPRQHLFYRHNVEFMTKKESYDDPYEDPWRKRKVWAFFYGHPSPSKP